MGTTLLHRYEPRGACLALFLERSGEVLISGPAGTGKSHACLMKLHMAALNNAGMRGLIVRQTLVSLGSTALVTWRRIIEEAVAAKIVDYYGGSEEHPPQYRYDNGSRIMIGGMDKPTKIMSSEYDLIYVQEAIELSVDAWEMINSRLRNGVMSYQQLLADTNPDKPTHWLKVRCDDGRTKILESRHTDNPIYYTKAGKLTTKGAAYMARLDNLTGIRKLRLRDGLWVAAEGIIYDEWDPAIHLIDAMPEGWERWTRWWGVDFGYKHPFVLQCWAEDGDGRLYLYREIYMTGRLVEDHARQILGIVTNRHGQWTEPKPRAVICDHDAEDRATLERHLGMSTVAAHKKVSAGLQAVQARHRVQKDGRPRFFICRDAVVERDQSLVEAMRPASTAEEFPGYVWADKNKEEPVKNDDDGCDTARYVVAQRDLVGRPGIRWL